jgi:hypothetical protein
VAGPVTIGGPVDSVYYSPPSKLSVAGGSLRTRTRSTLNLLLPSARVYEHSPGGIIEQKHSTDDDSPPHPPCICTRTRLHTDSTW